MDFDDTPEEASYRAKVRAWLDDHAGPFVATHVDQRSHADYVAWCRSWQRALFDGGWAGITWPSEYGGQGGTPMQKAIFDEEVARYGLSVGAFTLALGTCGPAIIAGGTPEQQQRHLPAILRGEHIWCQLFSEPGAGSDLASLSTRARRDGDEWIVDGQKVWTSGAHHADYGLLFARTNPDVPKHRGLTLFIVDMTSPGIEIRPLRQMTGDAHFNEVFLTDVRLPGDANVGPVDEGWRVALTALASERTALGTGILRTYTTEQLATVARTAGLAEDPLTRQRLAAHHIRAEILRLLAYRVQTALSRGEPLGPESSVSKLAFGRHVEAATTLMVDLLGPAGVLADDPATEFCAQWGPRLGGGTEQIQRNVLAERVLGLPREPVVDRDVPWSELHR
ncbi:MAG: acyl-CoA dehydrogenase family protein [Acidimicrobiales bacterium]|nr:acyl-CoA dehydrogenase family protein [Acidimicrobiales bacterium]